jgi:hypothetical protein
LAFALFLKTGVSSFLLELLLGTFITVSEKAGYPLVYLFILLSEKLGGKAV